MKKIKSVFTENTYQFLSLKKSDLYLMKIQISFCVKKIKFENTDHILS